jgi:transcriptional regulator GlxA family with amidase domain
MRIYVVALEGAFDTGLAAVLDTLGTANELAPATGTSSANVSVTIVGVRARVCTAQGLRVPVQSAENLPRPDAVVVPAISAKMPDTLAAALKRKDVIDTGELLRLWADKGALISAACTSTFVLAETALLDGRRATTTWWLAPMFRERYPNVELDESRMLVDCAPLVTAGAALAHFDLALWLLRRVSPALAALTARYLVVEPRASQAAYIIPDHLAHSDPLVERFERWARGQLAQGFSLGAAAQAIGTSERTLARRMQHVLGKSPLAYFQDLRVERAVHLLQTSSDGVDQIAAKVGYSDGVTLRTLLRKKIGRSVRELRMRRGN